MEMLGTSPSLLADPGNTLTHQFKLSGQSTEPVLLTSQQRDDLSSFTSLFSWGPLHMFTLDTEGGKSFHSV